MRNKKFEHKPTIWKVELEDGIFQIFNSENNTIIIMSEKWKTEFLNLNQ